MANFAPRAGIVWNPSGKGTDTLRIGGALLYETNETWFNERETTNPPIGTAIEIPTPAGGFSNPWQGYPGGNPVPDQWQGTLSALGWRHTSTSRSIRSRLMWRSGTSPISGSSRELAGFGELPGQQDDASLDAATERSIPRSTIQLRALPPPPTRTSARRSLPGESDVRCEHTRASTPWTTERWRITKPCWYRCRHRFGTRLRHLLTNYTDSYCVGDTDFGAALADSDEFASHSTAHSTGDRAISTRATTSTLRWWPRPVRCKGGSWAGRLLSNWQLAPLFHASSGQPLTVMTGKDHVADGI